MGVKKNKLTTEDEINHYRLISNASDALTLLNKRNEKDNFDLLVRAEVTIEDYLYVHGSVSGGAEGAEELRVARKQLETIINSQQHKAAHHHHGKSEAGGGATTGNKQYQKSILLEARMLMMKLLYIFGEMRLIDSYFVEADLKAALSVYSKEPPHDRDKDRANPRIIRLVSEAFAIKGLQLEHLINSKQSVKENPRKYFELSANACLSFLKCLDSLPFAGGAPTGAGGFNTAFNMGAAGMSGGSAVSPTGMGGSGGAISPLGGQSAGGMHSSGGHAQLSCVGGGAPNVTNFIEYAVHRVPSMLFLEGDLKGSVNKLRDWLQLPEIRHSTDLRALLARQLAEILLRFVSESSYTALVHASKFSPLRPITTDDLAAALGGGASLHQSIGPGSRAQSGSGGRSLLAPASAASHAPHKGMKARTSTYPNITSEGNSSSDLFVPECRTEEVLLLLLITEALISKDLVLDMGPEHKCLRNKKVDEEKFVLDLLTIALISGEQYNLLAQAVERGMSVAFDDVELWFKFGLSLMNSGKYSRAVLVLNECARLDPHNHIYHSLVARVALQHLRQPPLAIHSLQQALKVCQSASEGGAEGEGVTCYEEAKIYLLLAIAHAMKGESSSVNISDKHKAWELARNNFSKAFELDDMDPCIAYNYALCLAKSRKIMEACSIIRNFEDYPPAQELNILLLTSMKRYSDSLVLVSSYLDQNAENITLLFLKIAIEEKLFGPAVAAKNVKALAVHLTKLGFPAITFWDGSSIAGISTERQLSMYTGGGGGGTLSRSHPHDLVGGGGGSTRLNVASSFDGLETHSMRPSCHLENFTLSDGVASSIESPHQMLQVLQQNLSAEDDVNMNIWMLMFEFFIKMGKLTDARNCLSELKKIIRSDKSMYHVHYATGILEQKEGSLSTAETSFKEALVFNPQGVEARHRLAGIYQEEGSLECAEKLLRECLQIDTYHERSWEMLGEVLMQKGDEVGACESLKTSCNLEKSSPIKPFSHFLNWAF